MQTAFPIKYAASDVPNGMLGLIPMNFGLLVPPQHSIAYLEMLYIQYALGPLRYSNVSYTTARRKACKQPIARLVSDCYLRATSPRFKASSDF